jgi:hypothetical protein
MWAVVTISVCAAVMFLAYMAQSARAHEREEQARLRKEYEDAKEKLRKALNEHPEDFLLHDALGDRVRRLRERVEG